MDFVEVRDSLKHQHHLQHLENHKSWYLDCLICFALYSVLYTLTLTISKLLHVQHVLCDRLVSSYVSSKEKKRD